MVAAMASKAASVIAIWTTASAPAFNDSDDCSHSPYDCSRSPDDGDQKRELGNQIISPHSPQNFCLHNVQWEIGSPLVMQLAQTVL